LVLGPEKGNLGFRGAPRILGESLPIKEVRDTIRRVSKENSPVLITGETGTGKELVAQAIHALSRRARGPFQGVNCAALSETLLESESFGHAAGAFTGSTGEQKGFFQVSRGGTLLLDEIGDMPLAMQPKLLRAIEEKCIRPVGGDSEVPTDVRILAATNRDLRKEIDRGRFRADLFYRLKVLCVEVPPLRTRVEDILLLARYFLGQFSKTRRKKVRGFSDAAGEKLLSYQWPGNVRELKNCIEEAVALSNHSIITPEDLHLDGPRDVLPVVAPGRRLLSLAEMERQYILHVLKELDGNRTAAAEILGLDRRTLQRKLGREGTN
jgi:transcriptional regulator with PAS, ATPase and Fis domain